MFTPLAAPQKSNPIPDSPITYRLPHGGPPPLRFPWKLNQNKKARKCLCGSRLNSLPHYKVCVFWRAVWLLAGLLGQLTPRLPNCVLGSYMSPVSTVRRFTDSWCHSSSPLSYRLRPSATALSAHPPATTLFLVIFMVLPFHFFAVFVFLPLSLAFSFGVGFPQ